MAQKVQFFSLWVALETVGGYLPFTKSVRKIRLKKKKSETRFLVFPAENVRNIGFSGFSGNNVSDGYLTIYMGKPEIPVVKSNSSRHSVWYASENMSCDLRQAARDAIQSVFFTF